MKIHDILVEGKFSTSIYAYHATDKKHLKSILKHGLIPNKSSGGYGSEEISDIGYSKAPMGGVYYTESASDVINIAKSLHTNSPVVIVMKIEKREGIFDEDELVGSKMLDEAGMKKIIFSEIKKNGTNMYEIQENPEDFKELLEIIEKKLYSEIFNKITDALSIKTAASASDAIGRYINELINFVVFDDQNDYEIRKSIDDLSKKLRYLYHKSSGILRGRITKDITFSGASKIVGVFDMNSFTSWGDIGGLRDRSLHSYDSPLKLIKESLAEGHYTTDVKSTYGDLNLLKNIRHEDTLGYGNFATAVQDEDPHMVNKIEKPPAKMFYTSSYKKYVDWIINNDEVRNNPHFPRIYGVDIVNNTNKNVSKYKMEKLVPIDDLNRQGVDSMLMSSIGYTKLEHDIGGLLTSCIFYGEVEDTFTPTFKKSIMLIHKFRKENNLQLDLTTRNIMARRTPHGVQLVFTDPFYG